MILTTSVSVNTVLAADPSRDITQDVLKGLNEEYIKNRKK
jgi:Skp family chaperone for outer membrane proteins